MNNIFPSKEIVEHLRKQYPEGSQVELVSMNDPYTSLRPGDRGTVSGVDDVGTLFVNWDNGSGLGVAYGEDQVRIVENEVYWRSFTMPKPLRRNNPPPRRTRARWNAAGTEGSLSDEAKQKA